MKSDCTRFRRTLVEALASPDETLRLGWHEHLLSCASCRELVEAEQALELLLETLPEPRLPEDLVQRLLARLGDRRRPEHALDSLLASVPEPEAPTGLAERILTGLDAARTQPVVDPLDALLDTLPVPEVPDGLAGQLLERLAEERAPTRRGRLLRFVRSAPGIALVMAASLAFFLLSFELWRRRQGDAAPEDPTTPTLQPHGTDVAELSPGAMEDVDPELLAHLDLLENWELLNADDVDFLLGELELVDVAILDSLDQDDEEEQG